MGSGKPSAIVRAAPAFVGENGGRRMLDNRYVAGAIVLLYSVFMYCAIPTGIATGIAIGIHWLHPAFELWATILVTILICVGGISVRTGYACMQAVLHNHDNYLKEFVSAAIIALGLAALAHWLIPVFPIWGVCLFGIFIIPSVSVAFISAAVERSDDEARMLIARYERGRGG